MTPGISTACFYPLVTEKALEIIVSGRVEAVELFVNCDWELSPAKLREMRNLADSGGARILSLHPYTAPVEPILFFSGYQRRFEEGRELYKKYYQAANILGAESVVFHGGAKYAKISREEYFDKFGRLVDDSIENGTCLCHENVSRCIGRSSDFFREMADALPRAGFIFDVKQAVRAGEDVFDFARAMGDRIRQVHFSDHDAQNDCLPPSKGDFNTVEFLSLIAENGFKGGVIVELYRENFGDIVELFEGYQHLFTQISTAVKNAESADKIRQST